MAKSDIITTEVEKIIGEVWTEYRKYGSTAKEIQKEVAKRVQAAWRNKYKPGWPGLRAVQERLALMKDNIKQSENLDQPWHLGFLVEHPEYNISPEAVVYIEAVQRICLRHPDVPLFFTPVTIRQAMWIARLYKQVFWLQGNKDLLTTEIKDCGLELYRLLQWSLAYADYEATCKALGYTTIDTYKLDNKLQACEYPATSRYSSDEQHLNILFFSPDDNLSSSISVEKESEKNERTTNQQKRPLDNKSQPGF